MSWGEDWNGGPHHVAHCTDCGDQIDGCTDEVCETCLADKPVKCPECLDMVHPSHMTEFGCCIICNEFKTETI